MTHHGKDVYPCVDANMCKRINNQIDKAGQYVIQIAKGEFK